MAGNPQAEINALEAAERLDGEIVVGGVRWQPTEAEGAHAWFMASWMDALAALPVEPLCPRNHGLMGWEDSGLRAVCTQCGFTVEVSRTATPEPDTAQQSADALAERDERIARALALARYDVEAPEAMTTAQREAWADGYEAACITISAVLAGSSGETP